MDSLPFEILSVIFVSVLPTYVCHLDTSRYLSHISHRRQALRPLTLVSRYWRTVAYETSALWSVIAVRKGLPFSRAQLWLHRSKDGPLDVIIVTDYRCGSDADFSRSIAALGDRKEQWRSLLIHGVPSGERLLKSLLPNELPHLKTMVLCDALQTSDAPAFVSTPELQSLSISGVPLFFGHCDALRSVVLSSPYGFGTWKRCVHFLQSCTALETLELRHLQMGDLMGMDGQIEHIVSESLQELLLRGCSEVTATAVLRRLSCPSLKRLFLSEIHSPSDSTPLDVIGSYLSNIEVVRARQSRPSYVSELLKAASVESRRTRSRPRVRVQLVQRAGGRQGPGEKLSEDLQFMEDNCLLEWPEDGEANDTSAAFLHMARLPRQARW